MATSSQTFGPYRLVSLISAGNVCRIWEVVRQSDHQRLAMKLLAPGARHTKSEIAYLRHEFRVASDLDHPNVLPIHDFQTGGQGSWLVMEFFPHPNLKQRLQKQGPAELAPQVKAIVEGAASGLAHMHERGWIHRDVKPHNFLVSAEGRVKLIDFALARRKKNAIARLFSGKGKVQGTPSYMSPRQIRGLPVDERADVYSFGCMLFELITGSPPFTGSTTNELLNRHLKSAPPSLRAQAPNVTVEFAKLVARMLAKEPDERPRSMLEFLGIWASMKPFSNPIPQSHPTRKSPEASHKEAE